MAAGDDGVLADLAGEAAGCIPDGGQGFEEVHAGEVGPVGVLVVGVGVAGDGEGALDEEEHGELACACALDLSVGVDDLELRGLAVVEAAGGEVGGAGEAAGEGEGGLVLGVSLALHLLYSLPWMPSRVSWLG